MQYVLIIALQLGILYWLSERMHGYLTQILYHWFKTEQRMVWVISFLFWPGVLIHELSHLLMGRLLLVKTTGLTIVPKMQGDGVVRMGSVSVPKTDRLRFFLIGIAPVFVGLGVIFGLLWLADFYELWSWWVWWLVLGYGIFQVSNNMFLSSSDVRGALGLFIIVLIIVGLLYWLGWRPSVAWLETWLNDYDGLLARAVKWLWVPLTMDVFALILFRLHLSRR